MVISGLLGLASTSKAGVSFGVTINDGYARGYAAPRCETPVYVQPSYGYSTRYDTAPSCGYTEHRVLHEDLRLQHHDLHVAIKEEHEELHRAVRYARAAGVPRCELSAEHRAAHRELSVAHREAHDSLREEHREGHYDLH